MTLKTSYLPNNIAVCVCVCCRKVSKKINYSEVVRRSAERKARQRRDNPHTPHTQGQPSRKHTGGNESKTRRERAPSNHRRTQKRYGEDVAGSRRAPAPGTMLEEVEGGHCHWCVVKGDTGKEQEGSQGAGRTSVVATVPT